MINAVFEKIIEKVRKHEDINLVTTAARRNDLASEPNFHTTSFFSRKITSCRKENNTDAYE